MNNMKIINIDNNYNIKELRDNIKDLIMDYLDKHKNEIQVSIVYYEIGKKYKKL